MAPSGAPARRAAARLAARRRPGSWAARARWPRTRPQAAAALAWAACGGVAAAQDLYGNIYIPPDVQHPGDYRHTLEVRSDGNVWASGRNDFGQLGDGTTVHRAEPRRVKSAVRYIPGLPVKILGLGPREPSHLDLLEGQTGDIEYYDYETERWILKMNDGAGTTRRIAGETHQLEVAIPLDVAARAGSSRRRVGCLATDLESTRVFVLHDDGSRDTVGTYTGACLKRAAKLKLPDMTVKMYLPRLHEERSEVLNELLSEHACTLDQCTRCNTFPEGENCTNDVACQPPGGRWEHNTCRFWFSPGLKVRARQILLTPHVELNKRAGHLVQYDPRDGMEWEAQLTPLTCLSGSCDSGNVLSVSLPLHHFVLDGEAYEAAAGAFHSLFLWKDWTVWATGKNSEGQLGDGTTRDRSFPTYVLGDCSDVAAGWYHSLFLRKDGTVMAVGRNTEGQLGDGTRGFRSRPALVKYLDHVREVAAGAFHSVFLKGDGTVWATGSNIYGQLGTGGIKSELAPVQVASGVQSIRAGDFFSLFIKYDPITELTTLTSAGLFDSGLQRSKAAWEPLQNWSETEVQQMSLEF